jgi:hypothetical protein
MLNEFKRALARIQSDYGFFIGCQTDPAVALAGYDLSTNERSALANPRKLAEVFERGVGDTRLIITISGSHDWINRSGPVRAAADEADREGLITRQVEAVKQAPDHGRRTDAAFKLMELIG